MAMSEAQKKAASDRMKKRHADNKAADKRLSLDEQRGLLNVHDTPEGYTDRWVNDIGDRIEKFRRAGFENVTNAEFGESTVDKAKNPGGPVSRPVGSGVTAYLMRTRIEYREEDRAKKQAKLDETEASMRRSGNQTGDGHYGKVEIGRKASP